MSIGVILLYTGSGTACAEVPPARLADDFAVNTLDQYQVTGDVTWQKGQVTLGSNARLVRPLPAGFAAELRAVVRLPRAPAAGEIRLYLGDRPHQAGIALRLSEGRTVLVDLQQPDEVVVLDLPDAASVAAATVWSVRFEVRYGLARVKAWPHDAPEPKAWRSLRWLDRTAWEAIQLEVQGGPSAGGILEAFTVKGLPPEAPVAEARQRQRDRGRALSQEAAALFRQAKFREALPKAAEAVRLNRESLSAEHPDTANALNNLGVILQLMGRYAEARSCFEEALAIRKKVLGPKHPLTAASVANLGRLLQLMGRYAEARPYFEEALAIRKEVVGPQHPATAASLHTMGMFLRSMGRPAEARPYHEEALAICRNVFGPEHPSTAGSLDHIGGLLQAMGQYAEARSYFEEALAIRREVLGSQHPLTATSLNNLGTLFQAMGRHANARRYHEEAVAICKKALGPQHPRTGASLTSLARLLQAMGQHAEARSYYEEALEISKKVRGPEHPDTASALSNLGVVFRLMGRYGEARPYLEEALTIRKNVFGPEHPDTANALNNLGVLLEAMGRYGEARPYLEEALTTRKKVLGPEHPDTAASLNNLGMLLQATGRRAEARRYYEEALATRKKVLGPEHPDTAASLNNLGMLLHELGAERPAWENLAHANTTLAHYLARTAVLSAQRDHAALVAKHRRGFDLLLNLAEQGCPLTADQRHDLLANVIDWRAVSAAALTLRHEAILTSTDHTTAARFDQLRSMRQQLANLLVRGPGRLPPEEYRRQRDELSRQEDQLERELAERVQGYWDWQRHQRAGAKDIATQLTPGEVLVELVQYRRYDFTAKSPDRRWQSPRYAAVLLWRAATEPREPAIRFVPLGDAGPIDQAVQSWRAAVQGGVVPAPLDQDLRQRVWEPLAQAVPAKTQRLVVVPDGELALLPFEAIRLADGRYLIEDLRISYLSNGRDLLPRPFPSETSRTALILADPDYDALGTPGCRDPQSVGPSPAPAVQGLPSRDWTSGRRFRPLPGFAREARTVTQLLQGQGGWTVRCYQREQASEEALSSVPRPRLLYLITHGFFLADRERQPVRAAPGRDIELVDLGPAPPRLPALGDDPRLRSGVALAGANRWRERAARGLSDGLLTALEVENLDLWGTELVVLSACETGLGAVKVGEDVLGLRRAFEQAGAQAVLAALWKVPDAETEALMRHFFRQWLKGVEKAEALRQAQLALIRQLRADSNAARRSAPPLYWAGFVCHGPPR
jgi:tetratricopeptide (TPR) repeat protein/CHAT domain-containing protein